MAILIFYHLKNNTPESFIYMSNVKDLGRISNSGVDRINIQNYFSSLWNNTLKLER